MLIGDELAAHLGEFQAHAESRMRDTCQITRPSDERGELNPTTGKYDAPDPVVIYEGKCRIPRLTSVTGGVATAEAGDAVWKVGEYPFAVPITDPTTASIQPGDTVNYLTAADNPALVGMEFGIVDPLTYSASKDRRFRMKKVVG